MSELAGAQFIGLKLASAAVVLARKHIQLRGATCGIRVRNGERLDLSREFELLSIDIDGFDYQVWPSLRLYRPIIIINGPFHAGSRNGRVAVRARTPAVPASPRSA
jgi:hypothetical protein